MGILEEMRRMRSRLTTVEVGGIGITLRESLDSATKEKKSYTERLENARGDAIYKYLLLINTSALDAYVAQARLQADQSFRLSRRLAIAGFALLSLAIVLSITITALGQAEPDAAYLAAIAGALTQFVSGVMFYIYNRTLQQINKFHDKLVSSQQIAMAFLASSQLPADQAHSQKADLAKALVTSISEPLHTRLPPDT